MKKKPFGGWGRIPPPPLDWIGLKNAVLGIVPSILRKVTFWSAEKLEFLFLWGIQSQLFVFRYLWNVYANLPVSKQHTCRVPALCCTIFSCQTYILCHKYQGTVSTEPVGPMFTTPAVFSYSFTGVACCQLQRYCLCAGTDPSTPWNCTR